MLFKNGEEVEVEVNYAISIDDLANKLSEEGFKNAVNFCCLDAKYKCTHPATFSPKHILVSRQKVSDTIIVFLTYTAKNSFGVPDELLEYYTFLLEQNKTLTHIENAKSSPSSDESEPPPPQEHLIK